MPATDDGTFSENLAEQLTLIRGQAELHRAADALRLDHQRGRHGGSPAGAAGRGPGGIAP